MLFLEKLKTIDPEKYNEEYIRKMSIKELSDLWTDIVNYGVMYQEPASIEADYIKDVGKGLDNTIKGNSPEKGAGFKVD